MGRFDCGCINGKSGDCTTVRENGSASCNSGLPACISQKCFTLHTQDYLCMERMRSISDVLSSNAGDKTLPLPLSPCIRKQHGLEGTAADPRISRRLYGLALSQETVIPSANISERSFQWQPN